MKRYTISHARERLADVLDEAERSGAVVIERRGVQYVIRVEHAPHRKRAPASIIETLDPAVSAGRWRWNWTAKGLRFGRHGRRR